MNFFSLKSSLALTKLDVLDELDEIKIGVSYRLNGQILEAPPATAYELEQVEVEYITLKGWKTSISGARSFSQLPQEAQIYVSKIEELVGVPGEYIERMIL